MKSITHIEIDKKFYTGICTLFLMVLLTSVAAQAAPGELDFTFDGDGKVTTQIGGMAFDGNAVAIQADGKIIVAGRVTTALGADFAVFRYNANGSLDTTFDGDGMVTTVINNNAFPFAYATSVAVQADGQILVAGTCANGKTANDYALVRYNLDGSLDTSFDGDGIATTDINLRNNFANAMTIQADGKIVVAGNASFVANANLGGEIQQRDFAAVRYNSNGSLDSSFDFDGIVTIDIGSSFDEATAVTMQTDGKVVLAGFSQGGSTGRDFSLARFNSNGTPDSTFDLDGQVTSSFSPNDDQAYSIAMQSDGKIVAAGYGFFGSNTDIVVARYDSSGALDTTFDTDGFISTDILGSDAGRAVKIQTDGKIIVAGDANGSDFAVVRYQTTGALDASWGTTGIVTTDFGTVNDIGKALAIQANGKAVVAGHSGGIVAVARYNSACDDYLDPTFGSCGKVATQVGNEYDIGRDVARQADGKIVVVGRSRSGATFDFAVVRYNADGTLDSSFDGDGKVTTPILGLVSDDNAESVVIQPDNKIVVAGYVTVDPGNLNEEDFAVVRYNADGSLDISFDFDGKVTTSLTNNDLAISVALQSDGKIVVSGSVGTFGGLAFSAAMVRYNADGTLDTTFDGDGKVTTPPASFFEEVKIQTDGKIVAVGFDNSFNEFPAIVRYNTDGSLDTTFDGDGIVITGVGGAGGSFHSVAFQTDGKIVAGGTKKLGPGSDGIVVRYNVNGSLDTSFDGDGIVQAEIPNSFYDDFRSIAIQANGKIVAVGGVGDFTVFRYNTNGSLDNSSWGTDGMVATDIASSTDTPWSVIMQPDGKLVLAGYLQYTTSDARFATVRYLGDLAPTAASVSVGGRVVTADGRGIAKARVSITDQTGETRTALTNPFGYFRFDDIEAGQTYFISAQSKRYLFENQTQVVFVGDSITDLHFNAFSLTTSLRF